MKTIENRDGWTPERKQIVITLWNEGQTAESIGSVFGVSRSAILGVVHRMGLQKRRGDARPRANRKPITKFNFASGKGGREPLATVAKDPFVHRETVVAPEDQRIAFEALEDGRCKYAHGDDPPYSFCGAKAVAFGVSWCATHFQVVTGAPHPSTRAAGVSEKIGELEAVE